MGYEYIRQLTVPCQESDLKKIYDCLKQKEFEIYSACPDEKPKDFFYLKDFGSMKLGNNIFYVAAADRPEAVKLLEEAGYGDFISEAVAADVTESEVEKATRMYYKKRKWFMIEWAIVIVAFLIFLLIKSFL